MWGYGMQNWYIKPGRVEKDQYTVYKNPIPIDSQAHNVLFTQSFSFPTRVAIASLPSQAWLFGFPKHFYRFQLFDIS